MKKTIWRKLMLGMITIAVAVTFMPAGSFAASKVKMTAYNQVIVSGNTAYCAGAEGLYKVTLDGDAVTEAKILRRAETFGEYSYFNKMKLKGSYIYSNVSTEGTPFYLVRVNKSTGKRQQLAYANDQGDFKYVIKGKKIYYKPFDGKKKVMKLNGKAKKKTSTTPKMTLKKSNKAGYSVRFAETESGDDTIITTYLQTPAGTFKLGSHTAW